MKYLPLLALLLLWSCDPETQDSSTHSDATSESELSLMDPPAWVHDAVIYEVNLRQYSEAGDFQSFTDDLERIRDMGVDILWFMPIFPISEKKRKGELGSYYAASDFRGANPEYGSMEDVDAMIQKIHDLGMYIILDWVPNHTGWDHAWITDHPEYYTKNAEGEITDPLQDDGTPWGWTDVADLDYDNAEMRAAMIDDMKWWLTEKDIDGFRMDVAHGVPTDFWIDCNRALMETKRCFLLAEAEIPEHRDSAGFHASYAWTYMHLSNEVAAGKKTALDIPAYHAEDQEKISKGFHMYFTSNHDENSWNGTVEERYGDGAQTFAAVTFLMDGMPLIYSGMEAPITKRLEFFQRDPIDWNDYAWQGFYTDLAELKHKHPALRHGEEGGDISFDGTTEKVLIIQRSLGDSKVYGIFNLTDQDQSFPVADLSIKSQSSLSNQDLTIADGNYALAPWQYIILAQ